MALAVVLFVAGYSKYTHQEAKGSPLERLMHLSWGATVEFFRGWLPGWCKVEALSPRSPNGASDVRCCPLLTGLLVGLATRVPTCIVAAVCYACCGCGVQRGRQPRWLSAVH
jgi:hypothetical protein